MLCVNTAALHDTRYRNDADGHRFRSLSAMFARRPCLARYVELALAALLAAAVVIAAVLIAAGARRGGTPAAERTDPSYVATMELNAIVRAVRAEYRSAGNYRGVDAARIARSGRMPAGWVGVHGIKGPFGSYVRIQPTELDSAFAVRMPRVPPRACARLAAASTGFLFFEINRAAGGTAPMRLAAARQACAAGNNTLTWAYR
jgi:hypothetical protein